ncbi:hypothetical protein DERP_007042 [Dermatophagoides pteronyssinus]|uniref:Uncharacterized protein n=1 Tax=Dermatophagoides pteronyssinus TaxID=6956 RepID=A0ABQ8JV31_DERPT|nr:hypothetical protein DERP_007042 [Dermatophagoides pteronyssinus]
MHNIIDLVGVRERFDFDVDDKYLDFFIAGVGIRDGVRLQINDITFKLCINNFVIIVMDKEIF